MDPRVESHDDADAWTSTTRPPDRPTPPRRLTGMAHDLADAQHALAAELRDNAGGDALPGTLAEVVTVAARTDGGPAR